MSLLLTNGLLCWLGVKCMSLELTKLPRTPLNFPGAARKRRMTNMPQRPQSYIPVPLMLLR